MAMIRLQKILSSAGIGSRRACEGFIQEGRISVDGVVITRLGAQADSTMQSIEVDGVPIKVEQKVYYLLNKPGGYLCTNKPDSTGRPLAVDLIRRSDLRLFCVGRLDVDSRGAIIITNDGMLSNYITHPRYDIPKTYRVRINGLVGPEMIETLSKGVWLAEGRTGGADVTLIRTTRMHTILKVTIKEGKNRIIRRIMAKLDLRVTELERTRIGSIALGKLAPGDYRELKQVEINKLIPRNKPSASKEPGTRQSSRKRAAPKKTGGFKKKIGAKSTTGFKKKAGSKSTTGFKKKAAPKSKPGFKKNAAPKKKIIKKRR